MKRVADAIHQTTTLQAKTLLTGDVLRSFLLSEMDQCGEIDAMARCARYEFADGEDEAEAITAHLQRMGDTDLLRTTAHFMLYRGAFQANNPVAPAIVNRAGGPDTKAAIKAARTHVKAKYAERIKVAKAQLEAQNASAATAPAGAHGKKWPGTKPEENSLGRCQKAFDPGGNTRHRCRDARS